MFRRMAAAGLVMLLGCGSTGECKVECKQKVSTGIATHSFGPYQDLTEGQCDDEVDKKNTELESFDEVCEANWTAY